MTYIRPMFYYQANKNWLLDLKYLLRSKVMRRILRAVLAVGLMAAAITITAREIIHMRHALPSSMFSLLGVVLSIMLVFRTNTAYDRWWEGRKQWGSLVNNSRNLAAQLHASLPVTEAESRHYLAKHIANFGLALKEHLRSGVKMEELLHLSEAEKSRYAQRHHIPNFIVYRIQHRLKMIHSHGHLNDADYISLQPLVHSLLDIAGACERIKKTPIPFSYTVYLKTFILLYSMLLPLALVTEMQYYTIPITMFVAFAMIGVEMIGEEIEDPFGTDSNDLTTGDISATIRSNVFELFNLSADAPPPLEPTPYTDIL